MALLFVAAASCTSHGPSSTSAIDPPPDFSLVVTVAHVGHAPADPTFRPAQYVLTADGTLHAAVGPGSGHNLMPAPTAWLSPTQFQVVWQRCLEAGLHQPAPDEPQTRAAAPGNRHAVRLATTLTAHGRTVRQHFHLADRPDAQRLLGTLAGLRGDARGPGSSPTSIPAARPTNPPD